MATFLPRPRLDPMRFQLMENTPNFNQGIFRSRSGVSQLEFWALVAALAFLICTS